MCILLLLQACTSAQKSTNDSESFNVGKSFSVIAQVSRQLIRKFQKCLLANNFNPERIKKDKLNGNYSVMVDVKQDTISLLDYHINIDEKFFKKNNKSSNVKKVLAKCKNIAKIYFNKEIKLSARGKKKLKNLHRYHRKFIISGSFPLDFHGTISDNDNNKLALFETTKRPFFNKKLSPRSVKQARVLADSSGITSIGNTSSGADFIGPGYQEYYQIFWDLLHSSNTVIPWLTIMSEMGPSAQLDWNAGKAIVIDLNKVHFKFEKI